MATVSAPDVTKRLFGGVFDVDGSGHYPGLELINLVVCCDEGILPQSESVHIYRVAHDFARELITDTLDPVRRSTVLIDDHSANTVAHLLRCLELDVPNIVKTKSWERTHFFPYTRSLVHWDARRKGRQAFSEVQLERRYLRGAGAYAFSVLRRDENTPRLEAIRKGFEFLYPENKHSPLEKLMSILRDKGKIDPKGKPSLDRIELESIVLNDHWDNLYRDGVRNLLSHTQLPAVQRVRALMNWTSIWLVLAEAARAWNINNPTPLNLIIDCAGTLPQLRRAAQRCFKDCVINIEQVSREEGLKQGELSNQQMAKIRGFFGNTAAAGGLLNAWKGRRHFTLRLPAIEALVLASVATGEELEYEDFLTNWLFERCRIVAGREGAARTGMLVEFDGTIFEENERRLAEEMKSAGMLRVFSDATRMVTPGGIA